ncbi:helix-turn-helix domain-containing protein [Lacticaseibacillus mingshuiensis]|uniref:helix-turn-helix domain-containing protein n=1 Tax=Lacticaseibacillus mingshuiensis TaxID=2799574 RepID=UPI0019504E6E|nr:helix-turn-helix transcriptional regulator [Lacticaseibacillus mingshuiensis]
MGYIGPTIRDIRTNKGLSAKYMYNDIMSRVNYSRFESGKIDTSAENLMEMLKRINLMMFEFANLSGRDTAAAVAETDRMTQLVAEGHATKNPENFREASRIVYKSWQEEGYVADHDMYLAMKVYADFYAHHGQVIDAMPELRDLLNYLDKTETWYSYEQMMLYNLLPIFSVDELLILLPLYLQRINKVSQMDANMATIGEIFVQAFQVGINHRDYGVFKKLLGMFNETHIQERYMAPHFYRRLYNDYANYYDKKDNACLSEVESMLATVRKLDFPSYYPQLANTALSLHVWLADDAPSLKDVKTNG